MKKWYCKTKGFGEDYQFGKIKIGGLTCQDIQFLHIIQWLIIFIVVSSHQYQFSVAKSTNKF
jgi:hypothetical protein